MPASLGDSSFTGGGDLCEIDTLAMMPMRSARRMGAQRNVLDGHLLGEYPTRDDNRDLHRCGADS